MKIYLIEHADPTFTGFFGGVDFYAGLGSTSSLADAQALVGQGHRVAGPITHAQVGEGADAPSPVLLSPAPEKAKPAAKPAAVHKKQDEIIIAHKKQDEIIAARKKQDAIERNPDSAWSKRRAAEADKAKKRGGRRRK